MSSQANISRWKFRLGDGNATEAFNNVEEVFSISNLGKDNDLIDVTNFDSPVGQKEYISGLADGAEITIECNYIPNATYQEAMIAAVNAGTVKNFEIAYVGSTPEEKFSFAAVPKGWNVSPSPTERNTISFTIKISGDIS